MRQTLRASLLITTALAGCSPGLDAPPGGDPGPRASQVQPFLGRIGRDGRAFVSRGGEHFPWRGVSEFLLGWYLFAQDQAPADREALVAGRMDLRRRQGYTVLRVFGMVDWSGNGSPVRLRPADDWDRYKTSMRRLLEMARERGLYVEWVLFTGLGSTFPRERRDELIDWAAGLAQEFDNTFVELANEGWKNGLSGEEVYAAARRFHGRAPDVLLAGTSPEADGVDPAAATDNGHPLDGRQYGGAPFGYITLHSERADGDDGWRWVRHLREGELVGGEVNLPVVQDEPIGSAAAPQPGRRDSDARRFRAAALVSHATRQYFTFHHECAVTATHAPDCADTPTPGAAEVLWGDLIPADPRGAHFVNGHWGDSPLDPGGSFDSGALLRLFTKKQDNGPGFWSYPVYVRADVTLRPRAATRLTVLDVATRGVREQRDFAAGEALLLRAGSDVVIYGGGAAPPGDVEPDPPRPTDEAVPAQRPLPDATSRGYRDDLADDILQRLYRALLGREVDPSGRGSFAPLVAQGHLQRVVTILVGSPEFEARRPQLGIAGLSQDLYRALLDRAPDDGGLAATKDAIRRGDLVARVVDMILSPEFAGKHP